MLVHVGPAKPSRLPEVERRALLSDTSSGIHNHSLEQCSLHSYNEVYLGTSDPTKRDNNLFGTDDNSFSVESESPGKRDQEERQPASSTEQRLKQKRNFKLNFHGNKNVCDVPAPLATPETFSETSSMDSRFDCRRSDGCQSLIMTMPPIYPIQQTSLRQQKPDNYNCVIQVPNPVGYGDSPERKFTPINHVSLSTQTKCHTTITTEATVESCASNLSSELSLDDIINNSEKRPTTEGSLTISPHHLEQSIDMALEDRGHLYNEKLDIGMHVYTPADQLQLVSEENKFSFETDNTVYVQHSSDTPDSYVHQVGYDLQGTHYSHAGRGYPHGTYMAVEIADPGLRMTPQTSPNALPAMGHGMSTDSFNNYGKHSD